MQLIAPLINKSWRKSQCVFSVFTPEECEKILQLFDGSVEAGVTGVGKLDKTIRSSRITWLPYASDTTWIFDRLTTATRLVNEKIWKFQLSGFDALQLTRYEKGDFYSWHEDNMESEHSARKLSFVVQLSYLSQYEGGELVIFPNNIANKAIGTVTFFPSFLTHKVAPVTQGVRFSLVGWVTGEPFR